MNRLAVPAATVHVLALLKDGERYIFHYDDASRTEALRTLGRFAANPELSFSWYDAVKLANRIRQEWVGA